MGARLGRMPRSPFQIGGAGAVGTGSMRGMPILPWLRGEGFSVWPFDPPGQRTVIEIYPRLSVGRTRVNDREEREKFLERAPFKGRTGDVLEKAAESEDAFDALCALMDMISNQVTLKQLERAMDPDEALEGRIWIPLQM